MFKGNISALIPLYAFGVFTGFTLSQAGMVRHHLSLKEPGWRRNMVINGLGSVTTFIIASIVVISKFTEGAWIPAVLIPMMVVFFRYIGKHYARCRPRSRSSPATRPNATTHYVVVLVGSVNKGVLEAHPVRQVTGPRAADRGIRRRRRGRTGSAHQGVGRAPDPDRAAHDLVAVP